MTTLVALPIVLPLVGAALSILCGRSRAAQRAIGLGVLAAVVGIAIRLLVVVDRDGTIVVEAGGWAPPLGISLVADRFSATMVVVAAVMLLAVLVYAIGEPGAERNHVGFQSVYLVLAAGVSASFLTGDLFNLFVAFEMMLTASYVLLTLGGREEQIRSGMTYIVISLLASTLFVTSLALLYSATGTVNMSDLAVRLGTVSPELRSAFALLLLVVFGIKAALFPLFFWLPDSYPIAPSPITAIFAGLLTKVGIYAIVRTQTLMFPNESRPATILLVLAAATMVIGVLGALAQDDVKRILSFTIVSQIGYLAFGLGLFTVAGLAATIFSMIHHIVVTTALFLAAGLIDRVAGSSRLTRIAALVRHQPLLSVLFLVPALGVAGIPPLSGFVSKFALIDAGLDDDQYVLVGVSLVVSLLTLLSMIRIWAGVFWSPADDHVEGEAVAVQGQGRIWPMAVPAAAVVLCSVTVSLAAGPVYSLSDRAARDLLNREAAVVEVLRR